MLLAKKNGEGLPPIEEGTHHAVCFGVIDLGTHHGEYQGKPNKAYKCMILWELPDVRLEGGEKSVPRFVCKQYTLSLSEKASLYKDLTSWRGRAFTPEELDGFDVFNVIGANCILQIIHTDKGRAKIAAVAKLMRGMVQKKPESQILKYSMTTDGFILPDTLPEWIKNIIKDSDEYKAVQHARQTMGVDQPDIDNGDSHAADENDDIPF